MTITPTATGAFSAGVWSGSLTVTQAATGMHLRADDGAAHRGESNTFDALDNQAPSILSGPTATPNPVKLPAAATVQVTASDDGLPDPPAALTYAWSTLSGPGSVSFSPNGTAGSDISTATFPAAGSYVLSVLVSDGTLASAPATVSVTVNPANGAPNAVDDSATTDEDTPVTVDVLANDSDPEGDTLTVTAVTQGTNGSVVAGGGTVTYTPDADWNGTDSFTYTIGDGNGGADTGTVTVTVNAVNDSPTAVDEGATTNEDTPVTVDVLANDTDPEGDTLTVTGVT
ncbi:MAG: tandem-95 repeat protein, partial [Proteobacteria bacterium]|nr:tandem-95 repeat protein [Pseudomonadota bacterium]